jgi:hypothetical protein
MMFIAGVKHVGIDATATGASAKEAPEGRHARIEGEGSQLRTAQGNGAFRQSKVCLGGAGYDIWGLLKEDSEVLEGPPGELSAEDIKSCCPVLLAIAIPMI